MSVEAREGILLSRHWQERAGALELELWFATQQGPLQVVVQGQKSVSFLRAADAEAARVLLGGLSAWHLRPLALRDFGLSPVLGLYCDSYRVARQCARRLADAGLALYEADINPADRYLMERFVRSAALIRGRFSRRRGVLRCEDPQLGPASAAPEFPLAVLSFDIETAMSDLALYSIAVHCRRGTNEVRKVFMLGAGAEQDFVVTLHSERELLQAFLDFVAEWDPDVLVGWNVVNFDTWYLQRIADKHRLPLGLGRDRQIVQWRELSDDGERRAARLAGRVLLDGIEVLRAAFYRFESFALDHVAGELLGEGKLLSGGGRGEEIGRLFREDKTALAAYNLRDCELVSAIFEHCALLDFALARSAMTGLDPDRPGGSVASFDNLYLPRLHRAGYVAPNVPGEQAASPGGFVLDSRPGLYDHVLVLDFKSLYPSIIRTFCIDPLGLVRGAAMPSSTCDTVPGFLGAQFAREGHILPEIIAELWTQRDAARVAGDQPLTQAIKIIMNSFYGVLGSPGCRFFDARLASSITRRGHEILQATRDRIEALGHRVIYGDTDSVFVWVHSARSDDQAELAGRELEQSLNRWWAAEIEHRFALVSALELQFETHYRRFLMPTVRGSEKGSKKRYAGLVADAAGERLVFKGLESVRSDWTRLARTFQQALYRRIFAGEPYEDFVREQVRALIAGECDQQLVYRKRLRRRLQDYQRNIPPHVRAARLAVARGQQAPRRGDWVSYVMTTAGAEPLGAVLAPLDYQHYLDRQLEPVADGILGFVGSGFRSLVERQLGLFSG